MGFTGGDDSEVNRKVPGFINLAKLELAGDGGEFFSEGFVESPEGFLIGNGTSDREVTINKGKLRMFNIEI